MILTCPNCDSRFLLSDQVLGEEGRKVKCSSCSEVWFQKPEDIDSSADIEDEDILEELQAPIEEDQLEEVKAEESQVEEEDIPPISEEEQPEQGEALDSGLAEPDLDKFGPEMVEDNGDSGEVEKEVATLSEEVTKKIVGYLLAFLVFILTLIVFIALYGALAQGWKGSQSVYKWFGFSIESPAKNLVFDGISVKMAPEGDGEKIVLSGNILNLTGKKIQIPAIEASLRNEKGEAIESWIIEPPQKSIKGGEEVAFEKTKLAKHKGAVDVRVRFVLSP